MRGDPVLSTKEVLYAGRTRMEAQLIGMTLTPTLSLGGRGGEKASASGTHR